MNHTRIYFVNAVDEDGHATCEGASAIEWNDGRVTVRRTEIHAEHLTAVGLSIPWMMAEFPSIKAVCQYFRGPGWRVQMTHIAADHDCDLCQPQQWLNEHGQIVTNFKY